MEGVLIGEAPSSKGIQDHHHLSSKLHQSCPNWSPWINLPPVSFQNNTEWLLLFFFFHSDHLLVLFQITPHLENKFKPYPIAWTVLNVLAPDYHSISPGFSPMPRYNGPLAAHQTCQLSIHFKIFVLDVSFIWDGLPPDICITGSQT